MKKLSLVALLLVITINSFAQYPVTRARVIPEEPYSIFAGSPEEILSVAKFDHNTTGSLFSPADSYFMLGAFMNTNTDGWDYYIKDNGLRQGAGWSASFGGTGDDFLKDLLYSNGKYLLAGYSNSMAGKDKSQNTKGLTDYWIVMIDSGGTKLWDKDYGGTSYDYLSSVKKTKDGGFILAGYTSSPVGGDRSDSLKGIQNYWLVKIDSLGNKQWDHLYGSTGLDYCTHAEVVNDGYVLFGYTYGTGGDVTQPSQGGADYWLVKTDLNGKKLWDKRYGATGDDIAGNFDITPDGGFILGGTSASNAGGSKTQNSLGGKDFWIIRTDSNGNQLWDKTLGGDKDDVLNGNVEATTDRGFLLSGISLSDTGKYKYESNLGGKQMWMIKTDSIGNYSWDNTTQTNANDNIGYAFQNDDTTYCMAGYTNATQIENGLSNSNDTSYFLMLVPYHTWRKITSIDITPDSTWCESTSGFLYCNANTGVTNIKLVLYNGTRTMNFTGYYKTNYLYYGFEGFDPPQIVSPYSGVYSAMVIGFNPVSIDTIYLPYQFTFTQPVCSGFTLRNDTLFANNPCAGCHYQWNKSSTLAIVGATNSYYVPPNSGEYTLCVSNGCRCCASQFVSLTGAPFSLNGANNPIGICVDSCMTISLSAATPPDSVGWYFPTLQRKYTGMAPYVCFNANTSANASTTLYDVDVYLHYGKQVDTIVFADFIRVYGMLSNSDDYTYDGVSLEPALNSADFAADSTPIRWTLNGIFIPGDTTFAIHPTAPGTYNIYLKNNHGCTGNYGPYQLFKPGANFTSNIGVICDSGCIRFTDLTSHFPTSWHWSFPGANPDTSSEQNPQEICYGMPGSYPVTLISGSEVGSDTLTIPNYITILSSSVAGTVTAIPDSVCNGTTAQLKETGGTGHIQWQSSADGVSFSNLQNDTTAIIATSRLSKDSYFREISSGCGNDTSVAKKVVVFPLPVHNHITSSRDTLCSASGVVAVLTADSNSNHLQWQSSLSGATFSNFNDTLNTYTTPPSLSQTTAYRLLTSNSCGTDSSNVVTVHVVPEPVAKFNYTINGNQVTFNADSSSRDVTSYYWDFADGSNSNDKNPSHTYSKADTFYVCLTVYNNSNCSYTLCKDVNLIVTNAETVSATNFIHLYPNPANSTINLSTEGLMGNYQLKVYNVLGQQVLEKKLNLLSQQNIPIDLTNMSQGEYELVLLNGNEYYGKRFVLIK